MSEYLRLFLEADTDGTAELFAEVNLSSFAGASSAWFSLAEIREFGECLHATYPIEPGSSIGIQGGYWSKTGGPVLEQQHLALSCYPIGGTGTVGVRIVLQTPIESGERPESQSSVMVELKTHYEQLRAFGAAIVALAHGIGRSAMLEGSTA